ncbi:FxsA family protein [Thalassotalea sp. ND16A]|uniref:FxsA family protein n=1 Tax=Thalassotalea sp. ND16A TaxID=1535422 RepID=UPI00051A085E|nr:FxsA family protein [Thalassotalea sp. ND16A]KGJ87850.1 hypothetical protein ND16A_2764 [Thalassotalea sp. ND16A]
MFKVLFLLFIVMPIVEIMVLMNVGGVIGVLPTIAIVILTAWVGAAMVRQQGLATYQSVQYKLAQGQMPSEEIIAALLLLVAGVLLLTPGFITDGFGLLLLWPVSRAAIVKAVQKHLVVSQQHKASFFHGQFHQQQSGEHSPFTEQFNSQQDSENRNIDVDNSSKTIDGEFERKD